MPIGGNGTSARGSAVRPVGRDTARMTWDGVRVDMSQFFNVSYEPQGVTYASSTGQWYLAEVTDTSGSPSTIHEYNTDGTSTGNTFTLPDESTTPNHVSGLDTRGNGFIWAIDYNAGKVYKVDWSAQAVDGSFTIGGGTLESNYPSCGGFVPMSDGTSKLAVTIWNSSNLYVVNEGQAITDGTASGNVFRTLDDNMDDGRIQGFLHYNGYYYFNKDNAGSSGSSYQTYKGPAPYVDEYADGDPVFKRGYEYVWAQPAIEASTPMQDIGINPNSGYFWTCEEANFDVFRATESSTTGLPNNWSTFSLDAKTGPYWDNSLLHDNAVDNSRIIQQFWQNANPVEITAHIYDHTNNSENYLAVSTTDTATRNTMAINSSQTSNYVYMAWNSTDGWHETGVSRPSSAQWVQWRWTMDGSQTTTEISKDGGQTWSTAGTYTVEALNGAIAMLEGGDTSSTLYFGPLEIRPL